MIDITFITSNPTKLAHARYLCKNYDINILQYKKIFYGKGYIEPRILDREKLLKESINDAKKRWEKNVSNYGNRLFFIEDTSVRIEALSDSKNEVPGVDIKYWMEKNDFAKLDTALRESGNNRNVSVSSHIILFLTDDLKKEINSENDYIVFTSTSYGKIVEKEEVFETQILYPWLDNVTFNKWFVPNGFALPISRLNISDADKGDFRKGAFEKMHQFLCDHNVIKSVLKEFEQSLRFNPIFIICGPTCAGKSTIGKFLLDKYEYYHIEASDFMSLRYLETHGTKFIIDKNIFASELLKVEPYVVVDNVSNYVRSSKKIDSFVITGFRTVEEIDRFNNSFPHNDIRLIFVNSEYSIRYNRWINRHRDQINYNPDSFLQLNQLQERMGLVKVESMSSLVKYENSKVGLNMFFNDFKQKIIKTEPIRNNVDFSDLIFARKITLEKAILIVLAMKFQENESKYYTTTEISHLINDTFIDLRKNKNNISRYFNQSFYPFYEIIKEKGKNKYKLSPTGYSEAVFLIPGLRKAEI